MGILSPFINVMRIFLVLLALVFDAWILNCYFRKLPVSKNIVYAALVSTFGYLLLSV